MCFTLRTTLLKWPFNWTFITEADPQIPHCLASSSSPKCSRPLPCMNWTFSLWIDSSSLPSSYLYQAVGFNLIAKGSRTMKLVLWVTRNSHRGFLSLASDRPRSSRRQADGIWGQVWLRQRTGVSGEGAGQDRNICSLRVSRQVHSYYTLGLRNASLDSFGFFQGASPSLPWHSEASSLHYLAKVTPVLMFG